MWEHIKGFFSALKTWWGSDQLSSRSVRIPLKLVVVGTLAVCVLAVGLYGAGKLRAYADSETPATAVQLTEYRNQIIAACASPAKVEPSKKSKR